METQQNQQVNPANCVGNSIVKNAACTCSFWAALQVHFASCICTVLVLQSKQRLVAQVYNNGQ